MENEIRISDLIKSDVGLTYEVVDVLDNIIFVAPLGRFNILTFTKERIFKGDFTVMRPGQDPKDVLSNIPNSI